MRLRDMGKSILLPVLVVFLHVDSALAVTVTGGAIGFGSSNFGTADLMGQDFRFTTPVIDAPGMFVCQICDTGTHSLNVFVSSADFAFNDSARAVIGSTSYVVPRSQPSQLSLTGTFVVPPGLPSQSTAVTAPFTLSGFIQPVGHPRVDLQGAGLATVQLRNYSPGNGFLRETVNYSFQAPSTRSAPPPTAPSPSAGTPVPTSGPPTPVQAPTPVGPPLPLADVAAMDPSLLNLLRECGMCAEVRDLGMMASGRRGVQLTPLNGGFLSGSVVAELDPNPAGGPARLVNPEPTTLLSLLTGTLWLIGRRLHQLRRRSV
jgi:hypothetical protein